MRSGIVFVATVTLLGCGDSVSPAGNGEQPPTVLQIAFMSERDGNAEIYIINSDGSGLTNLTNHAAIDAEPVWSPDGSKIAFQSRRDGNGDIWVMNADGSNQRQVTDLGGASFAPFFHPDGRRIIFSSNHADVQSGRDFNLFLVDLDGSNLTQVTTHGEFDGFPMFSPDGTKLVFAANRYGTVPGETNIFIVDWVEPDR